MVGTPDYAIPAEALDHVFDIGTDGAHAPVGAGIGDDAGDLGIDVGQFGDRPDVFPPGVEARAGHVRHAAVIEDEGDAGRAFHQLATYRQLVCPHAEVEAHFVLLQVADVLDE